MMRRSRSVPSMAPALQQPSKLDNVFAALANERSAIQQDRAQVFRRSRRLNSAGSIVSGVSSSCCSGWSRRSTVLDLELQLERERREAAEAEAAKLRSMLANC
mmetsp:Transcript_90235/g.235154  ORF Transcript_90235/g.235154 Transcript_90235/m.235154 type:complete len:103 (+) Transcript_90235:3-311(+)